MSKLIEKILITYLNPILSEERYIQHHQFGFGRQHSITEQRNREVNVVKKTFKEQNTVLGHLSRIRPVRHEGLLAQLPQKLL